MMRTESKLLFTSVAFGALALLATACPASLDDRCSDGACVGQSDGGTDVDGEGGVVGPPPGCQPQDEPTSAPNCVVNSYGVFVAPGGTGDGTKERPLGSIQQAIELASSKGLPRVYVCKGEYREKVRISKPVSLFGGFSCSWAKSDENPRVGPDSPGFALQISGVVAPDPLVVADIEFVAAAAKNGGESSIAIFVADSSDIVLRRIKGTAGAGQPGANGAQFASNLFSGSPMGKAPAVGTPGAGGLKTECACVSYGMSVGAPGGNGGTAVSVDGKQGGDGGAAPILPPPTSTFDGHGGAGAINPGGSCSNGTFGAVAKARNGGAGATSLGMLLPSGWAAAAGGDGEAGNPGQGGGGGGGDALAGGGGGGGGGGCGGCGGAGGKGGQGGGASIALLSVSSTLKIIASELSSANAGKGGDGSAGEGGGAGGGGAMGMGAGCSGREGGAGAGGGGGGGAAGGISAGIVFKGKAPTIDGAPATPAKVHPTVKKLGVAGGPGLHGSAGTARVGGALDGLPGVDGTDGLAGEASAVVMMP